MSKQSGVTLIEILVAVSLLSLLTVGMLVAMHLGLNTMDKTDSRLVQNRRVVNARKILESEIEGFTYSEAVFRPQSGPPRLVSFLQAEPQSMRFVTSYSLEDAWRGRMQIAALQVIPGENNQGVRLIVNETPYTGELQAGQTIEGVEANATVHFAPIVASPQSFVLADHLKSCRFLYLQPLLAPPFQIWRSDWPPLPGLPRGIRIEMDPGEAVTVPLAVDRIPGLYAD